jgi:putative intracellular protease/amidase
VNPAHYDAMVLVGGQSPMFTVRGNAKVQKLVADFHEAGKVTALVCHATGVLLETRLPTGELRVNGCALTGFADSAEQFADSFVGTRIQPFWIESQARAPEGTSFVVDRCSAPSRCVTGAS